MPAPHDPPATRRSRRGTRALASVALAAGTIVAGIAGILTASQAATAPPRTNPNDTTDWLVYHRYASGSGVGPARLNLSHLKPAWTSPVLDGELYGNPLVWGSDVYVATENDTVYALSASKGRVLWHTHLATPVPSGDLPCGDISPTVGITSTPVIDTSRKEIFVVADELVKGSPRHVLYGLHIANGKIELGQRVDPPGAYTPAILQRASLTLDDSRVIFGYGGNDGDCSSYHGWLESVPVTGGKADFFEVDHPAGDDQGAIWMGGAAPVIDSKGHVWAAAGNGSVNSRTGRYDDSDSVLELSATMKLLQFFAPRDWYSDNGNDYDLGSSVPALLGDGMVVQAGKSHTAYLLKASHLGGIGGQRDELENICGADVDGGVAVSGTTVYLPCEAGIMAISANPKILKMRQLWQTSTGAGGPPILAGGYVWTMSRGTLFALNPRTGSPVQQLNVGKAATHFPTPSVGDGLLFAPATNQVHAYRGS